MGNRSCDYGCCGRRTVQACPTHHRQIGSTTSSNYNGSWTPAHHSDSLCCCRSDCCILVHPFTPYTRQQQQQQNARPNVTNQSFPTGFNPVPASPNPGSNATDLPPGFFNSGGMNPNAAKQQIAALNAAGLARRAQATRPSPLPGGPTSASFLGGGMPSVNHQQSPSPAPGHDPLSALSSQGRLSFQAQSMNPQLVSNQPTNFSPSTPDSFMSTAGLQPVRQRQTQQQLQHKKQFLGVLASFHLARKDPLPPALTGVPYPAGFDLTQSRWKSLEPSQTELGTVILAGKPVDLYQLWAAVNAVGGWAKVSTILFA
jgi:SWI/SNF chromatin-remodeling complex subunit SWI1